jgi:4-hydroxy-2-oxoheptanedioate aldolase
MLRNPIRQIWAAGGTVVNGWLAVPNVFTAEIMASRGWDSLTIDMQHGLVDYQAATGMLAAIATSSSAPVVRIPWLDAAAVMKVLDAGALGIICPMINTPDDARRLIAWSRYAPAGTRSYGPIRARMVHGDDYPAMADAEIVRFAMIETREALDNLDEILAVPGLDAIYVGPSDLSLSLGCSPKLDNLDDGAEAAVQSILAKATAAGVMPGIHTGSVAGALRRAGEGFRFVSVGSDAIFLGQGASVTLEAMREGLAGAG